mmetsp:Transcript_32530/g.49046  ORF Transcript_32530/g.49046 Transcript_32530/m.49046 type:complete len:222 (+) Transcript_32530:64-729(+)
MTLNGCKLTYFGIPGRGEAIRLALFLGDIDFNDDRIGFGDWKALKPNTPWGSLPVLTLSDGTQIAQTRAILRFVGKETALYPTENHVKAAKVDELLDAVEEMGPKIMDAGRGMEEKERLQARKVACEEGGAVYNLLVKINDSIGSNGFAVGDSLTIADLFLYAGANNLISGLFDGVPTNALDGHANIMALRKNVRSNPGVTKWYDKLKESSVDVPAPYAAF